MRHLRLTVNGNTIRVLRDALGWNLVKFSAAVGVNNGYMSRVENGHRQPSAAVRQRIAAVLGVPEGAITRQPIPAPAQRDAA